MTKLHGAGMQASLSHAGLSLRLARRVVTSLLLAMAFCAAWPANAQIAPPEAQESPQDRHSAAQLEQLVVPYAGVPTEALVVIFDAARFPSEIIEAAGWLRKPEAERGAPPAAQASVSRLTREAPEVVTYLSSNIAATAALGSAYQEQPDDLWRAYGEMALRIQSQQNGASAPPADATATQGKAPAVTSAAPAEGAERDTQAVAPSVETEKTPTAEPRRSEATPAPPPTVTQAPAPPPVVVTQAPTPMVVTTPPPAVVAPAPPDTTGAALTGGAIGLVGGMALGALINENNNDDWDHPYPAPYPYPRPGSSGAYPEANAQAEQRQQQRQVAGTERQQQRQTAGAERQQQRQATGTERRQQRQAATPPTRAAASGSSVGSRSPSATRQASARPQLTQAKRSPAAASAWPRPAQSGWGPTVGMSGGGRAARGGRRG